jgi:hypothetical protein
MDRVTLRALPARNVRNAALQSVAPRLRQIWVKSWRLLRCRGLWPTISREHVQQHACMKLDLLAWITCVLIDRDIVGKSLKTH